MSFNPPTLYDLGLYWISKGGVNLGVVGNQKHCTGYHLGRDRIYSACACKPDGTCEPGRYALDYSVRQSRDKVGLTNAASAIDLGKLSGSLAKLYDFSAWLVERCQVTAEGTTDIREVIYWNPRQGRVERWDGVYRVIRWGVGQGDLSHKTHTHISYFRDSEVRDKRAAFRPYFDAPQPQEDTVVITRTAFPEGQRIIRFLVGAKAAGYVARDGKLVEVVPETVWTVESSARAAYRVDIDGKPAFQIVSGHYAPDRPDGTEASSYVFASDLIVADPDPAPPTCDDEVAAAVEATKASAKVVFA
jgi:hypothetical protein